VFSHQVPPQKTASSSSLTLRTSKLFSFVSHYSANKDRYAEGHLKTENVTETRRAISQLLEKYRTASAPIVHIVHRTPDGAPVFTPGTSLAEEFSELTPKTGEKVIGKQFPGSFTGTDLEEYIKSTGKNKVVLCGYMAHVCVSTTARQAAEKGYDVILPQQAIGDRDIPGVKAHDLVHTTLMELADAFGSVVEVADIE
jgi:nicotinamidase-related amidase